MTDTKLASFDLEIAKSLPDGAADWQEHAPLGISCAAIQLSHEDPRGQTLLHYTDRPSLARDECQVLVAELASLVDDGYTLVTWNGASFDWCVLAEESGLTAECAALALGHVDLMFLVVALRGHYLSLDKAAAGASVAGKLKEVTLSDGSIFAGTDGAAAPELWAAGHHEAVLAYLREDVRVTLQLARAVEQNKAIRWTSRKGYGQTVRVPKLLTVRECLTHRRAIPRWVRRPLSRREMVAWLAEYVYEEVSGDKK